MSNPTDVRAGIVAYVNDAGEFEYHEKVCTKAEYDSWSEQMIVPDGRTYVWGWGSPASRAMAEFLVHFGDPPEVNPYRRAILADQERRQKQMKRRCKPPSRAARSA
jgi:hypothetical protein